MKEITASGHTVDEAVQSALEQLNITRDQVNIEVIDEGKKGLLGIFGSKPAVVKVISKDDFSAAAVLETLEGHDSEAKCNPESDPVEIGKTFIEDVVAKMNVAVDVTVSVEGRNTTFNLAGESIGILIGKHGQTLNALQYLLHLVVNSNSQTHYVVILDAEGYRQRRQETLEALAEKMAEKSVHLQRKVALEPMPAFERKLIHNTLQRNDQISTYSDGQDPHRHIVIVPDAL